LSASGIFTIEQTTILQYNSGNNQIKKKQIFSPTVDIGVEDLVEGLHGHLGERRDEVDPRVVDKHVDAAVLPYRVGDGGADAVVGLHVELQQQAALEAAHGRERQRCGDDSAPGRRERARHRASYAALGASCHQHHRASWPDSAIPGASGLPEEIRSFAFAWMAARRRRRRVVIPRGWRRRDHQPRISSGTAALLYFFKNQSNANK
jgi:cytochrome c553